jgi:hypothetical protein
MTDPKPPPGNTPEARAAEAAAIRRRWINLGEILAVIAVLISGATLWLNWSQNKASEAEKAAQSSHVAAQVATLTLTADTASKGARLELRPAASGQVITDQTIRFPTALGVDSIQTTGEPRIEVRWFDGALKRAREKAGLPDDSRGDERLPVLIETRFLADGTDYRDTALYDVGYTIKGGGILGGHDLTLRGLSLVRRGKNATPAALDSRWSKLAG